MRMDMISPRELLKELEKRPRKRLGQHFLVHRHSVEKILKFAELTSEDIVLEIGAGLGALTVPVAERVTRLYAVEVDSELVRMLKEKVIPEDLQSKVEIIEEDVLKLDIENLAKKIPGKLKILGNLPYNISSPILFKLWDKSDVIEKAILMLQVEVAERLVARPGTKDYGILTVLFGYRANVKKGFTLKPEEFYPVPKVGSMVISIDFDIEKVPAKLTPEEEKLFVQVVKTVFGQRRKMLRRSLLGLGPGVKDHLPAIFETSGIVPDARPETLSVDDFCRLTKKISQCYQKPSQR